jgi:hypothetical protein
LRGEQLGIVARRGELGEADEVVNVTPVTTSVDIEDGHRRRNLDGPLVVVITVTSSPRRVGPAARPDTLTPAARREGAQRPPARCGCDQLRAPPSPAKPHRSPCGEISPLTRSDDQAICGQTTRRSGDITVPLVVRHGRPGRTRPRTEPRAVRGSASVTAPAWIEPLLR